ncbi:hypothetical protein DDB_G0279939 [Dictyostelium discoideum AX4]|uniref:NADH dehydrogenase [ubiquinone] 1 beta subcomplex subunit 2 n=1 Tax=Dictyostelium discoideum TaxID=44689 RepID=Q54W39_DICDI|nr:hypothetical protein DDB_G0279939 [Dictyostelium discoideum AX4]EAL67441.1 hypothetical protein DDB_G0279939 [Dictyostelium discoideum AX4]|eukprot:XP_641411.1 hypothetical protein DDB_G0279939 [Dictyostelium discoideum AX4]
MAGGHHAPFHVSKVHKLLSVGLGTTVWFWVFYRAKQDWRTFVGVNYPWDHIEKH